MPSIDLTKLSDRILNLLIRGAAEGARLEAPVARAVHDLLLAELARRNAPGDDERPPEPLELLLPTLSRAEAGTAYLNLCEDVAHLEEAELAAQLSGEGEEAQQYAQAAEFLYAVGLACLPPMEEAESGLVQ